MPKLTRAQRWKLTGAKPGEIKVRTPENFACPEKAPGPGSYPIHDKSHVVSAVSYYQRAKYQRCPGGQKRICNAARRMGIMSPKIKAFCERRLAE
jgi:hypothetical protein